jgi:prepilin-type N-terminal cleavage/methylation domain-containing protein
MNLPPQRSRAFTIVEVLVAVAIFSMIIIGIYAPWAAVIKASQAGLNAAASAQRARISIKCIQDALTTAQMFAANGNLYTFKARNSDDSSGYLSFVARLPASFPGVGHYGDAIVRRVEFYTDGDRNLVMTQCPLLVTNDEHKPYQLQLAKDVTLFMFEFWDDQKKEYVTDWLKSNQLPTVVRVAVGLGRTGGNAQNPVDLVNCTVAMPCVAVQPQWQRGTVVPGMAPGATMPGMTPGVLPNQPPGAFPPGMQPGIQPGKQPGGPGQPFQPGFTRPFGGK